MVKAYNRIFWENYPSDKSPINEANLNRIDGATDEIDNRVIMLDTTKLDKVDAAGMVKSISYNEENGVFTITYFNGATTTIDTKLEKLAINFGYDAETEQLMIVLDDGEELRVDLSALITQYEFLDSDTIAFSLDGDGKVSAIVKEGSIAEKHLQPNYLADIKIESAKAEAAVALAESAADLAKSYAVGTEDTVRENDSTDNAKSYYEQVRRVAEGIAGAFFPMGTIEFSQLESVNKEPGYMYNIKDEFVTDDRFKEGAGCVYSAGTNVYWTVDGYWDCLTGVSVTGVKGDAETEYRRGNVNITPKNIGLENVNNTADAEKSVKYAVSAGSANAVAWGNVSGKPSAFTPTDHTHNYLPLSGGTVDHLNIYHADGTESRIHCTNSLHSGNFTVSSTGKLGIYSNTHSKWVIYCDTNGRIYFNDHIHTNGGAQFPTDGNVYVNSPGNGCVGYLSNLLAGKISTSASCNKNWNWSGLGGQPTWIWGGEDGTNMYVYNPLNWKVNRATYLESSGGSQAYCCLLTNAGNFRPNSIIGDGWEKNASGEIGLGTGSYRWKQLYVSSSSISTSDRNLKDNIKPLTTQHLRFFMLLQPVSFTFRDGESGRTHIGFISQDVEEAMTACGLGNLDFAGFCKDKRVVARIEKDDDGNDIEIEEDVLDENGNPTYIYSLRYEEFIALIAYVLQEAVSRMDEQESRMNELDEKIVMLEQKIAALQQT